MQRCIGVRREDKSRWERRAPITPDVARELLEQHAIRVTVQPSPIRAFREAEFEAAGALVREELDDCPAVFGIKEIPIQVLRPGKAYVLFAHVIKGQPYNMPMLRRMLELGCTLIDYERIADDAGRRLIFFGHHAGLAGALETLWTLGRRLAWEGIDTPFASLHHAWAYHDLAEAREAVLAAGREIREAGLPPELAPLTVGVAGYGNVSRGVWEILDLLPVQRVEPDDLSGLSAAGDTSRHVLYATTFREEHIVTPLSARQPFDRQRYFGHPEEFRPIFSRYLPHLTALVNAIYWDARYPRLVTCRDLAELSAGGPLRLRAIGDISCDIEGSIECTVRSTEPDEPAFVYNPRTGATTPGCEGEGIAVMAVDILPSELPRDASLEFSRVLAQYVPAIAAADYTAPFESLALPPEIKRAVIAHRGELTPGYRYIADYLI